MHKYIRLKELFVYVDIFTTIKQRFWVEHKNVSLLNSAFCLIIVIKTEFFNSINAKCSWKEAAFD